MSAPSDAAGATQATISRDLSDANASVSDANVSLPEQIAINGAGEQIGARDADKYIRRPDFGVEPARKPQL
jgi:hypothetical protein